MEAIESVYQTYVEDPSFQILLQELRRFEFVSYITVHASLNNIAYQGDAATKQFIKDFKAVFGNDLNQMTDFLNAYLSNPNPKPESKNTLKADVVDISDLSRTILTLSFPFFFKSYNINR